MVDSSEILAARILIVDDQESNIALLKVILDRAGYTSVASTSDPREVCALHGKQRYDLILLDLLMPAMYGFQVIEGLKEIETEDDLPVLVISAEPDYKKRAMQAGAKEFIAKPVDRKEVLAKVDAMLRARLAQKKAQNGRTAVDQAVQKRSSRLRQSEELFRQIAVSLPDALWIREVEGGLVRYVNPAWEKITGHPLAAGDLPEKVFAAFHPEDLPWVLRETEELRSGGVDLECRIVRPDHGVRRVHVRTFLIRDPAQKIVRIAGIMRDITEHRSTTIADAKRHD